MINIKDSKQSSGIYAIINLTNGKIYVGSSKTPYYRLRRHLSDLRHNRHATKHLQNSFNKNGETSFYSIILEECEVNVLIDREEYWIKLLKADYNKTLTNLTRPSLSYSKEKRQKISESVKNLISEGKLTCNKKTIYVYLNNGQFFKEYDSITNCARELIICESSIIRCLNKTYKQCKGYQFSYSYFNELEATSKTLNKDYSFLNKKTILLDIQSSNTLEFSSGRELATYLNVSQQIVYDLINNNRIHRNKYRLFYAT